MASSATIRSDIYDKEERKQQYQAHIRGLNAYDRHKKFLNDYVRFYGKDKPAEGKLPVKTDYDTLREGYRFIRSEEDDSNPSWEQRLVKRYYDKLFKEYCIADMSRYKTGKMGLRWRTEKEVMSGKGQFLCGSKHCDEKEGLASYEVNFSYYEAEEHKQALVKLVACERCAEKLYYKRRKEAERSDTKEKKKQKRKRNRSCSEDDTDEEERRKGKRGKSKLEGGDSEAKDDENFDEFMEGMFPGSGSGKKRMKTRYGETRKHDKGVLWACDCSAAILVTNSYDPNTRGEKYLSCPYEISDGPGQGCGFRRWWIKALQDEFVKIRDEKNEMKQELDKATKCIEDHKVTIFEMELQLEDLMKEREKQVKENPDEHFDTGMGVVNLMVKFDELEKKYEALERKYQSLNKYL